MACVEDSIRGWDDEVHFIVRRFGIEGLARRGNLNGCSDMGTRLLFKFRSGTHGLNEQ